MKMIVSPGSAASILLSHSFHHLLAADHLLYRNTSVINLRPWKTNCRHARFPKMLNYPHMCRVTADVGPQINTPMSFIAGEDRS